MGLRTGYFVNLTLACVHGPGRTPLFGVAKTAGISQWNSFASQQSLKISPCGLRRQAQPLCHRHIRAYIPRNTRTLKLSPNPGQSQHRDFLQLGFLYGFIPVSKKSTVKIPAG